MRAAGFFSPPKAWASKARQDPAFTEADALLERRRLAADVIELDPESAELHAELAKRRELESGP